LRSSWSNNAFWFGPKRQSPVTSRFDQAWVEYQTQWAPAIKYGSLCDTFLKGKSKYDLRKESPYDPNDWNLNPDPEHQEPDPERDDFFDPARHDKLIGLKDAGDEILHRY
jgi:hypothetical protein